MNLGRIFASAIVRRLAYVLVAIALAWCGIGRAEASCTPTGSGAGSANCTYRGEAYAWAQTAGPAAGEATWGCTTAQRSLGPPHKVVINANYGNSGSYNVIALCAGGREGNSSAIVTWSSGLCPPDGIWDPETNTCGTCAEKPPLGPSAWSNVNASQLMCKDECVYEGGAGSGGVGVCFDQVIDGQRYTRCTSWGTTGATCSASGPGSGFPGAPSEAPTDSDGDGTSDGNDGAPNNPGQGGGGGENGEGQPEDGSGTCGGEGQPACGLPGTGSGNGNTSGGGGDCNTPPTSTGDAILAQIAYQTWATRCAITGAGNAGPGGGTGTGEGSGSGGEVDGDAEGRDAAMDGSENDPERDDVVEEAPSEEDGELDTSGYGYSRACVASPTVSVFGQTITFDTGPMCQWLELGSYFVLLLAALASARIIGGGMA